MSVYSNIRDRYYIYRIQKDSDFFRRISEPSFKLVSFMMGFNAAMIKDNHTISNSVIDRMISKDCSSISFFHEPDKRLVWRAAMKDPNVLKGMLLNEEQQMYVYSQNHKVLGYIKNPTDTLQATAIFDDWTIAMSLKEISPSACDAFLSSAMGISQQAEPEMRNAVGRLISEWRETINEYAGEVERNETTSAMYENLEKNGINGMPDYMKKEICQARLENSSIEFKNTTGVKLNANAPIFQSCMGIDSEMTQGLSRSLNHTTMDNAKSLEEVYTSSAEKIISQKNEIKNSPSVSREQLNGILGSENTEKLENVLKANGKELSDLSGADVVNLAEKGSTTMGSGTMLQKISGPAGYAMRAYSYMESMSSMGQCEM